MSVSSYHGFTSNSPMAARSLKRAATTPLPPKSLVLKMATAVFAKMLGNQHSVQHIPEARHHSVVE
jgi:hypothetical protein